ncbi:MAG: iron chelate uptake ABC transporter family permease subunit [Rhizobiaceae bacterium]|nr:iron chelate uptake ABC transporter family permease subunit [Rhizobiaceae bacterium]
MPTAIGRVRMHLCVGLALALLCAVSLFVGVGELSAGRLFGDPEQMRLMLVSRLPRTLAAVLAGAGLAIAGLVMQTLARNRFVEPATAGTAQSAEFGILLGVLVFPAASLAMKSLLASLAALAGTLVFLVIARRLPPQQPFLVPLVGLVYGGVVGAMVTFIAWRADLLQMIAVWTQGEFSGVLRGRYELLWIAAALVILAWWVADRLTIMSLGEQVSVGLGLDYRRMLLLGLAIVSVISAVTVVVIGNIPFVGLVVPAVVARLAGDNLRGALPLVGVCGAGLVLACDILGRVLRYPYEIPVGTVLGVVGAVIFLWLLARQTPHG